MELRPPLHLGVVAIEKGAFGSPSTKVANFTYIYGNADSNGYRYLTRLAFLVYRVSHYLLGQGLEGSMQWRHGVYHQNRILMLCSLGLRLTLFIQFSITKITLKYLLEFRTNF